MTISINCGYLLFFETTIMVNTADLAMFQAIIDTLHKEGKSQRVITESGGCSRSAVYKEWTEAGVSASRVTTLRHLQEKSYQDTSETETSSEASYLG